MASPKKSSLASTCPSVNARRPRSRSPKTRIAICAATFLVPVGNERRRNDVVMKIYIHKRLGPSSSSSPPARERCYTASSWGCNGGCGFISRLRAYLGSPPILLRPDLSSTCGRGRLGCPTPWALKSRPINAIYDRLESEIKYLFMHGAPPPPRYAHD